VLAGCGDAAPARPDAAVDAPGPRCDPSAPFHAPVPLSELNSDQEDGYARLSNDELTILFSRLGASSGYDLYSSQRTSIDAPFDPPQVVGPLNSIYADVWPSLTPDALTVYFGSDRIVPGTYRIWTSTRTSVASPWSTPTPKTGFQDDDRDPYIVASGETIFFASGMRGSVGLRDIFEASLDANGTVGTPGAELGGINTAADEFGPALPGDGLSIFFTRHGTDYDIYTASRSNITDGFGASSPVPGASEAGVNEISSWVSPDGCHLYFESDAPNFQGYNLYVMKRE
jgi:hypothetical protein